MRCSRVFRGLTFQNVAHCAALEGWEQGLKVFADRMQLRELPPTDTAGAMVSDCLEAERVEDAARIATMMYPHTGVTLRKGIEGALAKNHVEPSRQLMSKFDSHLKDHDARTAAYKVAQQLNPSDDATKALIKRCLDAARRTDQSTAGAGEMCKAVERDQWVVATQLFSRALHQKEYVDASEIGPLLLLTAHSSPSETLRLWEWASHTRAANCPTAQSAVIMARARTRQLAAALAMEGQQSRDQNTIHPDAQKTLVNEMLRARSDRWDEALKLVAKWRPDPQSAVALDLQMTIVKALSFSQQRQRAFDLVKEVFKSEELVAHFTEKTLLLALNAIVPLGNTDTELAAKALTCAMKLNPSPKLFGAMAGVAAVSRKRTELLEIGAAIKATNPTEEDFETMLMTLVRRLSPHDWLLGKVAAVELSRAVGLVVPDSVLSQLMILHQTVEAKKDVVVDAFFGDVEEQKG